VIELAEKENVFIVGDDFKTGLSALVLSLPLVSSVSSLS
jgi:myo-inositol-1-phosphate synthase